MPLGPEATGTRPPIRPSVAAGHGWAASGFTLAPAPCSTVTRLVAGTSLQLLWPSVLSLVPSGVSLPESGAAPDFLCLKNIRTFLKVCHDKFGLRNSELFDPFDLFDVRDFGKFLCLKNIRTFLKVCHDKFGLRNSELFDPFDLFDVRDFGKCLWEAPRWTAGWGAVRGSGLLAEEQVWGARAPHSGVIYEDGPADQSPPRTETADTAKVPTAQEPGPAGTPLPVQRCLAVLGDVRPRGCRLALPSAPASPAGQEDLSLGAVLVSADRSPPGSG
ncbi:hypothetical protein CB1_000211006 [Camelus ferus]|nr:hypothetical protein CB1_000211006 [Camelus ferus]